MKSGITVYSGELDNGNTDDAGTQHACCPKWKFWKTRNDFNEDSYHIPDTSMLVNMKRLEDVVTDKCDNNNRTLETILGENKLLQEKCEELKTKLIIESVNGTTLRQVNQILLKDKRYLHQEISFLKCERKRLANVVVEQDRIARKERQQSRDKYRMIQKVVEQRHENEKRLEIQNELYAKYFSQATKAEDINKNLTAELLRAKKELCTVKNHMHALQKSMDNVMKS